MADLQEELNLPQLGGTLIVSRTSWQEGFIFKQEKVFYQWAMSIFIWGPDMRYKPGQFGVNNSRALHGLITALEQAQQKMISLKGQNFTGSYSEMFGGTVELHASNGSIGIDFWASSSTSRFKKSLTSENVTAIIDILNTVESRIQRMMKTLDSLSRK